MSISEKEVYEDFKRFIRHEAIRANITQVRVITIINIISREEPIKLTV